MNYKWFIQSLIFTTGSLPLKWCRFTASGYNETICFREFFFISWSPYQELHKSWRDRVRETFYSFPWFSQERQFWYMSQLYKNKAKHQHFHLRQSKRNVVTSASYFYEPCWYNDNENINFEPKMFNRNFFSSPYFLSQYTGKIGI